MVKLVRRESEACTENWYLTGQYNTGDGMEEMVLVRLDVLSQFTRTTVLEHGERIKAGVCFPFVSADSTLQAAWALI